MKILIFSWRGPGHPHAGGAEQVSHEHAVWWSKAGHEVTLFTSSFKGAKNQEDVDGVHIIRKGSQIFQVHLWAMIWYLFSAHPKFDIVVDEVHGIPFFTPLFVRTRKLVFIHEVAKEVWRLNPWPKPFNLFPALVGTLIEPLIFRFIYHNTRFMTVSNSTRTDLMAWGVSNKNITIVHNGFSNKFPIKQAKKESIKTIMYLGALSEDKGIEEALKVFKILFQTDKNWQFWIVGKGEAHYLEYLQKKSKEFGIEGAINFFGFVDEKEKYNLLSKSHILINPSAREGWGLVVIEAASVGTPTVAYNVAGLCDSVKEGKTGLLSTPDPQNCAEKINFLFGNKSVYNLLQKNCLSWSKKFSWEKSSKESLDLINKLTKKD